MVCALIAAVVAGSPVPASPSPPPPGTPFEVAFTDDGVLKVTVLDPVFEFDTPYGLLRVPAREVRRIDLAPRLPDADAREVDAAVADLTGADPAKRRPARKTLTGFGWKAVPAVRWAARRADPRAAKLLGEVLDELRTADGPRPAGPDHDLLATDDSQVAGRLVGLGVRVRTAQFGEQRVRFADVRSLKAAGEAGTPLTASADAPTNLVGYQGQFGKQLVLRVTGAVAGSVWGSGPYTLDSTLAAAAVHAGALRPGQAGVVRVRVVASPGGFTGSVRNGVSMPGSARSPAGRSSSSAGEPWPFPSHPRHNTTVPPPLSEGRMPQLEQALTVLLFAGVGLAVAGWLWLLIRAFTASFWWLLGLLLVPPLAALFLLRRPDRAGGPVAFILIGLMAVGGAFGVNAVVKPSREVTVEEKGGEQRATLTGATQTKVDDFLAANREAVTVIQMANRPDVTDDLVAKLKDLPNLRELDLNDTPVTDKGLEAVAALPKLDSLRIARTKVTADGVAKFVLASKTLKQIDVTGLNVPAKALREWKNADPQNRKYVN